VRWKHAGVGPAPPIHIAAGLGDEATTHALVEASADVDCLDADGQSALHHAVVAGCANTAKLLLLQGADYLVDSTSASAVQVLAEQSDQHDLRQLFIDKGLRFQNRSARADLLFQKEAYAEAWQTYGEAIRLAHHCTPRVSQDTLLALHFGKSIAAHRAGRHILAIEAATEALELQPSYAAVLCHRAACYEALADYPLARDDLEAAHKISSLSEENGKRLQSVLLILCATPCQVLGVAKLATPAEIKSAYKQHCLQWHPDRHCSGDQTNSPEKQRHAINMFQRANNAYNTLVENGRV